MTDFLQWHGWLTLNVWLSWIGLALAASFPIRYHLRTGGAWHRTGEGRWMLYGRALIAAVLALTLVNYYFPGWPGRRFASFVLFAAFIAHLWWPHLLLSQAQRKRDRETSGRR
ncbi:putative phage holin [Micromonospora chersina]|uniref:putative phage holin n=1 Tax=Micromonospora chersina TaxID=47854 RepID=UPI00371B1186